MDPHRNHVCVHTIRCPRIWKKFDESVPLEPPAESTSVRSRKAWQFESGGIRGRQLRTPGYLPPFVVLRAGKRRLDPVREAGSTYPNPTPTLPPKIQYSGLNLALKVQSSFFSKGCWYKKTTVAMVFFMNEQLQPNPLPNNAC